MNEFLEKMNETIAEYLASQVDAGDASDAAGDVPWNRVVKLLVISVIATVASTGNVFVISAVLMDDHLKKRGLIHSYLSLIIQLTLN